MIPNPTILQRAHVLLRERFGHQQFRSGQEAILTALLQGQNVLAVMPTGSGKSLCYQLPALLYDGCTLVISPLIALMKDQVDALQAQGIAATFVNSSLSPQEQQARLLACQSGQYKLLYVAPERFRSARFLHTMAQTPISLFAVDEAHCISEWGHDFRPDYLRLQQAIAGVHHPQVLALTATATVEVQDDIIQQLGFTHAQMPRCVSGFDRPNLIYRVLGVKGHAQKMRLLGEILDAQEDGSAIVYAATRRAVEDIAGFLHERGTEAFIYHAGLADHKRREMQEMFMAQQHSVIIATNAFGMGVDKADVRCVVHFNLPRSMEAYYQEAGRAGRDGLPAQCVLLFNYGDVKIQEFLLDQSYPPRAVVEEVYSILAALSRERAEVPVRALLALRRRGSSEMQYDACLKLLETAGYVERLAYYDGAEEAMTGASQPCVRLLGEVVAPRRLILADEVWERRKHHELLKMRRMVGYANAQQCRRHKILGYFGEHWDKPRCTACDICLDDHAFTQAKPTRARGPSEAEWLTIQKILSCVARMRGRYGRVKVVQVLLGSQASEIRQSHLSSLSTYGLLKGTPRVLIEAYVDALLQAACLRVVGEEFPTLDLTPLGHEVMHRRQVIPLALPESTPPPTPTMRRALRAAKIPALTPEVMAPGPLTVPRRAAAPAPTPVSDPESYDAALLERLREQRTALARTEAVPPYCVLHDRTLREIASRLPSDLAALRQIRGIGETKAGKYGATFLALIRDYLTAQRTPGEEA